MNASELGDTLIYLGLDPADAAQLLGIASRTMRRWLLEGEDIPGPAIVALRAWRAMHDRQMNWKPDAQTLFEEDQDQIDRYRKHIVEMDEAFRRVEMRGGPRSPWAVDLSKNTAILGPFEVSFYRLKDTEGFSLSNYRRRDKAPDLARDMPFLEDAAYCIHRTIAKARTATPALRKLASYTRQHSSAFAADGPKLLTPAQNAQAPTGYYSIS